LNSDLIVAHLDSVIPKELLKIARHHNDVKLGEIIESIKLFKNNYNGRFGFSSIFIEDINTSKKNIEGLKDFLLEINPDFYLVQEFNNEKFGKLTEESKNTIKETFSKLPFEVIFNLD